MTKTCQICGRRALKGNIRSHSNIATIHRQRLNLHIKKVNGVRQKVCTSCIRNLHRLEQAKA